MDKQQYIDQHINSVFASWLSKAALWGSVIFLSLGALDYASTPENFFLFLPYRITIALVLIATSALAGRIDPELVAVHRALAYAVIIGSALTIEVMIMKFGGNRSPYSAGVILLGIFVIGFIPARLSFHLVAAVLIYGIYTVPVLIFDPLLDAGPFVVANTLLVASLTSMLLMRYLGQKGIMRELGLKYDQEQRQAGLEEEVLDRTGQLNATIADLQDVIAERRKAEEKLMESEAKSRLVVEYAREGILIAQDGNLKFVNPYLMSMTGYAEDELLGRPFIDFIHPEDRNLVMQQHLRRLKGELPQNYLYTFRIVTKNGEVRWAEMKGALITWEGRPATVNVLADITERRNIEQALRDSEEKFRTLFEESKDVFYISTPEGKFLDINPAGVELFGYPTKEALLSVDITRDLYVNPLDRKRFIDIVNETDYAKDYEVQMKRKSGETLFVIITSTAVKDEKGTLTAFRGIIRDVTDQKKLQQQLLQSQKMEAIGQLAGGIAHDFNNILTAVVGYASILKKKMQKDDPQRVYVEHVLEASERGAGLTQSLLAFGRKQIMNPRQADLNEIVRHSEKLLARLIGEDITIRSALGKGELILVADSLQIEQVLMNLATNARDAMPRGGTFMIETGEAALDDRFVLQEPGLKPGNYAVMTVTDTGSGMDDDMQKKIFEPFFTTKEVGKGSGLGLAMVYGIVKQHNGHISVYSEPGKGTTFRIYLPLAPAGARSQRIVREESGPAPCGAETILLGEDDRAVRAMMVSALAECGYTVIEAEDGEDAINKFIEQRDHIDLLILDVIMPKKNGREVYDVVKKIIPGVKVLFISGYTADFIHMKEILDEGLYFVQKPFSMDALLRTIRAALSGQPHSSVH